MEITPPLDILREINGIKKEIANLIKTAEINGGNFNIPGLGVIEIRIPVSVPEGYTLAGIIQWSVNNRININIIGVQIENGNEIVIYGNSNVSHSFTVHPMLTALFIKKSEED
ncbi:MAG: hypothetical protein HFI31_14235 [Lachnospiraceae bacterium]|nr:hypothetical protein [Lachnospiraceae bacterium]